VGEFAPLRGRAMTNTPATFPIGPSSAASTYDRRLFLMGAGREQLVE